MEMLTIVNADSLMSFLKHIDNHVSRAVCLGELDNVEVFIFGMPLVCAGVAAEPVDPKIGLVGVAPTIFALSRLSGFRIQFAV